MRVSPWKMTPVSEFFLVLGAMKAAPTLRTIFGSSSNTVLDSRKHMRTQASGSLPPSFLSPDCPASRKHLGSFSRPPQKVRTSDKDSPEQRLQTLGMLFSPWKA